MNIIQTNLKRGAFAALLAVGAAQCAFADPVQLVYADTVGSPFFWDGSSLSMAGSQSLTNLGGSDPLSKAVFNFSLSNPLVVEDDNSPLPGENKLYLLSAGSFTFNFNTPSGLASGTASFDHAVLEEKQENIGNVIVKRYLINLTSDAEDPTNLKISGFGNYVNPSLQISLLADGLPANGNGYYGGSIALTADAVPEPVTTLLGLAGCGVFAARRRKVQTRK